MMASTISCLVATAIAPSMPPSASEPVSPMKIEAGGALNQRKPRPGADHRAAQHRQFAGAGDVVDLQIVGEHRVADEIGDQAEACRGDHHRHDGEAVEAVGQVHGVAGADDDEGAEEHEEPAEIDDQFLEERKRQRGREGAAPEIARARSRRRPRSAPRAPSRVRPAKPCMGLLGDLQVIVVEADRAEAERHHEHDPDIGVGGFAHSSVETTMPDRIISPPMVGVPFLVTRCDCGPSVRIGWPLPWRAQQVDDRRRRTGTRTAARSPSRRRCGM